MPRRLLAAALIAASLGAFAQQPPTPAPLSPHEELTLRAARRFQAGDTRGALADVSTAISRDSRYAGAYALRGTIRAQSGDRAGAIGDFTRAIELAPNETGIELVLANRAHALALEARHLEAAQDVARALALAPAFAPALQVRARLKADAGDLDGARLDLDQALAAAPKMMTAYNQRAAVHLAAGRLQEALSDYKTVMWSLPRDAEAVAGHGIVRGLAGETAKALDDLIRARNLNPLSVYDGEGAPSGGPVRQLELYRALNPGDGRAELVRGVIRVMNGDVAGGLQLIEQAVQLDPALRPDAETVRARVAH
jgi:tetratricopeptide (TPR) repeat protein